MIEIEITTNKKIELVDITQRIEREIEKIKMQEGLLFIFVLHTTASLFISENEEGLREDWINFFQKLTSGSNYQHDHLDGNAPSHLFGGLLGQSIILPVSHGKLLLGTWQRVFLFELDGPRTRKLVLKFVNN